MEKFILMKKEIYNINGINIYKIQIYVITVAVFIRLLIEAAIVDNLGLSILKAADRRG